MKKVMRTFRLSEAMGEALEELAKPDRLVKLGGACTKTAWLEETLAYFLRQMLKGSVRPMQLENARTPDDIFRLFVAWSQGKAEDLIIKGHEKHILKTYAEQVKDLPDDILRGLARTNGLPPAYKKMVLKEFAERSIKENENDVST